MIESKAVQRSHLNAAVGLVVVRVFDPILSHLVELLKRIEPLVHDQKAIAEAAKEPLDFSFGGPVTYRRMGEADIQPHTGLQDLFRAVVTAIVKIQPLGLAAFVEGRSKGLDQRVGVVPVKEPGVGNQTAGAVDKSDQKGLFPLAICLLDSRPIQGIALPEFIGVLHGKGGAQLLGGFQVEQVMFPYKPVKGSGSQLLTGKVIAFQQAAVQGTFGKAARPVAAQGGQHLINGLGQLGDLNLALSGFVGVGLVVQGGDAVLFVTGQPGLNGAPGKTVLTAGLVIHKGLLTDRSDTVAGGIAGGVIDGRQHLQTDHQGGYRRGRR